MDTSELKHRTFHAVVWAVVRIGASNALSFVLFVILARALSPHDFGVFALAVLVVDIARTLSAAGLSDAIMRDQDGDEILADTVFWTNLVLGCLVGGAAWLLAPFYAWSIDQPEVTVILRALAVLIPVTSLSGTHTARKLREFGHKAIAARTIGCGILGGGLAVAAALGGLGVWSLVIQTAVVEIIGVVFAWSSYPWRPRFRFDSQRLARVWAFSGAMLLTQVMGLLLTRIQDVVIGSFISVAAVGSYRIAWRMIDLIAQATIHPIVSVSYITLARLRDDPEQFRRGVLRMLGLAALPTLPAIIGFGVLSDDIIPLMFGAQWHASAAIAKVLAPMAVPFCTNLFLVSALAAMGRTGSIARSTVLQTVAALALSLLAAPFGVQWVAAAYVLRAYLMLPYHLFLFKRDATIEIGSVVRAIMPQTLAAMAMAAILLVAAPFLRGAVGGGVLFVTFAVMGGCTVYVASLLLCTRRYIRSSIDAVSPLWRRPRRDPMFVPLPLLRSKVETPPASSALP